MIAKHFNTTSGSKRLIGATVRHDPLTGKRKKQIKLFYIIKEKPTSQEEAPDTSDDEDES